MALSLSSMTAMLSAIHMQLAAVNSEKQMTLVKEKKKKSSISKNVYNKHYTWSECYCSSAHMHQKANISAATEALVIITLSLSDKN